MHAGVRKRERKSEREGGREGGRERKTRSSPFTLRMKVNSKRKPISISISCALGFRGSSTADTSELLSTLGTIIREKEGKIMPPERILQNFLTAI